MYSPSSLLDSIAPRRPRCFEVFLARALTLGLGLGAVVGGTGCTELNPDYDPDGGPVCVAGQRQCDNTGLEIEICTEDATGFVPLRSCFAESHCAQGACVPDDPTTPCARAADCTATAEGCTVAVSPTQPDQLGTWCLPLPYPGGRTGGQACTAHDQCQTGWCFRRVCFEACTDAAECTNEQHECVRFDVTVDGVRDSYHVQGCAPPQGQTGS